MIKDELIRWLCLLEFTDIVSKECDKRKMEYDVVITKQVKPNHIKEYIDCRFNPMANMLDNNTAVGENEFVHDFIYGE